MKRLRIRIYFSIFLFILFIGEIYSQYDVKNFGAMGKDLQTSIIQSAIDKAYENGGGTVDIHAGTYKIGTLILKDNINLHLNPGAKLLGSENIEDYLEVSQKFESRTKVLYAKYFMIFAENAKNISITGSGVIDGNGLKNFQNTNPQNSRPFIIRLVNCENVIIRDVRLLESANWTLHLLGCKDVNIDGIFIKNTIRTNRDGLDIDCCQRVTVSNSLFLTGDDSIVMKATCDVLCQDITITNCILHTRASAIKTGTESNGGFKNITISNCIIKDIPVHAGINLVTVDGGMMQNILLENIVMENVATPIFIRLGIRTRPYKIGQYTTKINDVKDIYLNNISVVNAKLPSIIMGLNNKKIQNLSISNYTVRNSETQETIAYNKVPLEDFSYPTAVVFKKLPAYGFYCRNVSELNLNQIKMYSVENEKRSAITFDRVNNLNMIGVIADVKYSRNPMIYFRNTKNVFASYCQSNGYSSSLFEKEEKNCNNFHLSNNYLQTDQKEIASVESLSDEIIFDDFMTNEKFSVENGKLIKGLKAQNLSTIPLEIEFDISTPGTPQLCLLILNETELPEKVQLKYEDTIQEFLVDWNEWGWAPISLEKNIQRPNKIKFEIFANKEKSGLKLSKVYVRYQDLGYTD